MTLCRIPRTKSAKKLVRPWPLDRNEEDLSKMVHRASGTFKGQLISECLLGVIGFPKN